MRPAWASWTPSAPCAGQWSRPVHVVMGLPGRTFGLAELAEAGVKRVSVGSALARLAYGGLVRAAREMRAQGTFRFAEQAMGFAELEGFFAGKDAKAD